MNASKTALILAVSGGIALSGCKEEKKAPPPSPKPPEAIVLEVKKYTPKSVESMSGRCRSQLETILNRQQSGGERGDLSVDDVHNPYKYDLSRRINLGKPNKGYNTTEYSFSLNAARSYEPCYALAQESLKNFSVAQAEANHNLGMYRDLDDDYREPFRHQIRPIHFNRMSDSIQVQNWFSLMLILMASGWVGAGIRAFMTRKEMESLNGELEREKKKLKESQEKSVKNGSDANKWKWAHDRVEKRMNDARGKVSDLEKQAVFTAAGFNLKETTLKDEIASLKNEMSEMEKSAAIGVKLSAEVSDILDFGEEFAAKFNEIIKKKRLDSIKGYSNFVAISGTEIKTRLERLSARVMRNTWFMNEANSGYFATMFALETEAKAFFGECRYKKAVETVMRAEGACEMIEAFFAPRFEQSGFSADVPKNWNEFKKAYAEHLTRIGALDENGFLIDFFTVMGIAKPIGGWSEAFAKKVEAAYRPKAQKLHPDKNPGDTQCEGEFKKLGRAKEVLREKAGYDFYVVAHALFFGN